MVIKCHALRDLVPFAQFKKHETPMKERYFSKVASLQKVTLFRGYFSRFLNGTKSSRAPQMGVIFHKTTTKGSPYILA